MNRLAQIEVRHIESEHLGEVFGQCADLELEENVFEHAPAVLHPDGLADGLDRNGDCHLLVRGHLVEVRMEDAA